MCGICSASAITNYSQADRAKQEQRETTRDLDSGSRPTTLIQTFGTPNESQAPAEPKATELTKLFDKLSEPLLWVTIAIASFTFWQVRIYRQMRDHNIEIERAVVGLYHHGPGLREDGKGQHLVSLRIRNSGNTHADILGGTLWYSTADQPGFQFMQLIEIAKLNPAWIASGDHLDWADITVPITKEGLDGCVTFLLSGEIDYRDSFGGVHKGGFGRRYNAASRDNLVFDQTTVGTNFDRALNKEEQKKYRRQT